MAAEDVLLKHPVERCIELGLRDLPGYERALRKVCRQQGLADATDVARLQHGLNPLDYHRKLHAGDPRNLAKRITLKSLDSIFRHFEDARVNRVGEVNRQCNRAHIYASQVNSVNGESEPIFARMHVTFDGHQRFVG